jgi:hypothetical protein
MKTIRLALVAMNFDTITQFLAGLSFRQAVWLFPFAFTLHVLEEVRQFTAWANRYASPLLSRIAHRLDCLSAALLLHQPLIVFFSITVLIYFPLLERLGAECLTGDCRAGAAVNRLELAGVWRSRTGARAGRE